MTKNIFIGYGYSTNSDSILAATEAVERAKKNLDIQEFDYAYIVATIEHDCQQLLLKVKSLLGENTKIQGVTSCSGIVTTSGFLKNPALAVMLIFSSRMEFGVGASEVVSSEGARDAGAWAMRDAMLDADRTEKPDCIIMNAFPGYEEAIISGIEDIVGEGVVIIGGSSADNTIEGKWKQMAMDKVYQNAVVVTAIYSKLKLGVSFQSGAMPTEKVAIATKTKGRVIYELDNRPAGEVYNEWLGGVLSEKLERGGNILMGTTLRPMGRIVSKIGTEQGLYLLSHPAEINHEDKSISLFSEINEGDRIFLMKGTKTALIQRAGIVTKNAILNGHFRPDQVAGALLIYCAGCMLTVGEDITKVIPEINNNLGNRPFIGAFTFGEEGCFLDKKSRHGNLMISMLVFSNVEV